MLPSAAIVFLTIFQMALGGRYSPPSDPREYYFRYTYRVPTVDEMIEDAGFAYEHHTAITKDGHILSLHRISPRNPSPGRRGIPVLFVNGFCFHSEGWMGLGRNTSIAFILSDLGYDVWLGDQRGAARSVGHVNYSLSDPRTYQYSFHEMGIYDLPAFIDHILNTTNRDRLFYVGLSLGSGIFTIMESEVPEMKGKVIAAIFLGPAIHLSNWRKGSIYYYTILRAVDSMISVSRLFLSGINKNRIVDLRIFPSLSSMRMKGVRCLSELDSLESQIRRKLWLIFANQPFVKGALSSCSFVPFSVYLSSCLTIIGLTFGRYSGNMNATTGGMQMATVVTSTSVYVGKHLFQVLKTGTFSKYDYGSEKKNNEKYGLPSPPKYDLSKVTTPLLVMYGTVDQMADVKAVERSINDMSSAPLESILLPDFNHVDYLFGRQAPQRAYVHMVDFFDRMSTGEYIANNNVIR